jgi:hypothetical protein|tara:strand:+ start:684 stop:1172 length:489 start_codon:yes stop_codon:yes gene_type:complete
MKSWKEQRKKPLNTILFFVLFSIFLLLYSNILTSDEMVFKFKSPSFSGINTSQHYLTIENQQFSRKQAIEDNKQALLDDAERDTNNSTLARFIRNLESRVYAKLSSQLVESLFGENPQTSGSIELEGNTIEYEVDDEYITLTVTDENGETTTITFPLNSFTF